MKKVLFFILDCTWAGLQNLLGLILFSKYRHCKRENFFGASIAYHDEDWGGISLGRFIVMSGNKDENWTTSTKVHEYGHYIQSLLLGPFYLLVIGLPSYIWCNAKKFRTLRQQKSVSYFSFYPERWANYLGERVTGLKVERE